MSGIGAGGILIKKIITYNSIIAFIALNKLNNENNFFIWWAEKSNTAGNLDTDYYLKSFEALLKDFSKFKNISATPDTELN